MIQNIKRLIVKACGYVSWRWLLSPFPSLAILFQDTRVANIDAGDARITVRIIIYNIHLCKEYILRHTAILTSTFENMSPVVFDV